MRQAAPHGCVYETQPERLTRSPSTWVQEGGETLKHTPIVVYRNSITGRIVTEQYADRHPRTTEREIVYRPSPKKG